MITLPQVRLALFFLTATAAVSTVQGQTGNLCRTAANCTACILIGPTCVWCFMADLPLVSRCDLIDILQSSGCDISYIFRPQSEVELLKNDPLRNADFDKQTGAVQLSPQQLRLRLSPGQPASFTVNFRVAEDYPVDLYYLMDLSYSMLDDKSSLIKLGKDLREALLNITRNVRMGFGAFVDKPTVPFISIRPDAVSNPCIPSGELCHPAYGYINRLPLTNDTAMFVDKVDSSAIAGNLDGAEGGFDALLQAVVCQTDIGWRTQARKLLVFATDDTFHIGGDGKIAGIVEPNDGSCHMHNDTYTHSLLMDYPSIGQISSVIKANSVNVIFAIRERNEGHYSKLLPVLPGSLVAVLADDSSNIVELVKNNYQAILSKVGLAVEGLEGDDSISVELRSSCRGGINAVTSTCDNLKIGDTVSFDVQITLKSCPGAAAGGRTDNKVVLISAVGLEEKLRLDVIVDCSCNCQDKEPSSSQCSGKGLYSCGSCYCDAGYLGSHCECNDTTAITIEAELQKRCTRAGSSMPCSGRGVCTACGTCDCNCLPLLGGFSAGYCSAGERYTGDFCECNPKGCNNYNGLLCGGQGTCSCDSEGKNYCKCNDQYENGVYAACECTRSTAACQSDSPEEGVCNGKGVCSCGTCQCTDSCYTGATCKTVKPECSGGCQEFRPCIECWKQTVGNCPNNCQNVNVSTVSNVQRERMQTCKYFDVENCEHTYTFAYDHASGQYKISLLDVRKCPLDLLIPLVAGIGGAVVLLGFLALVLWKAIITVHDRKEYEKFKKDALKARWNTDVNPLYTKATSTFKNPTYGGGS